MFKRCNFSFFAALEPELRSAVEDYFLYEGKEDPKRFIILMTVMYSTEGNEYLFAGYEFDSEPTAEEVMACAISEFEKYCLNITVFEDSPNYETIRADEINEIIDGFVIADTELLRFKSARNYV